jgi:hypothetical protein
VKWTEEEALEDLDYVDVLGLVPEGFDDLQEKTKRLDTGQEGQERGYLDQYKKDRSDEVEFWWQGTELKDVDRFTYLESIVRMTGRTLEDVESRIGKAKAAFASLNAIWRSKIYRKETKLRLYNAIVKSTLLFGSECWTKTKKIEKKLNVFHLKFLRRIMRVFYPNSVSNKEILWRVGQENIVVELTDWKWRWISHMARRGPTNLTKQSFLWKPGSKRKRGRPRETWMRVADRECKVAAGKHFPRVEEQDAEHREDWLRMVVAVRTEVAHGV